MKTKLIIHSSTIVSRDKLPSFVEVLPLVVIVNEEGNEKALLDIDVINIAQISEEIDGSKIFTTSQPNIASMYELIEIDDDKCDRIIIHTISCGILRTMDKMETETKEGVKNREVIIIKELYYLYLLL